MSYSKYYILLLFYQVIMNNSDLPRWTRKSTPALYYEEQRRPRSQINLNFNSAIKKSILQVFKYPKRPIKIRLGLFSSLLYRRRYYRRTKYMAGLYIKGNITFYIYSLLIPFIFSSYTLVLFSILYMGKSTTSII